MFFSAWSQLAGDGSFRKKKFKEICKLRLNLPIKISYIPDFEKILSRSSKVITKKSFFLLFKTLFVLEKKFILAIPTKLAKIIGVC